MKRRLGVYLGAHPQLVGHLHYNRDGARESAIFAYDDAWLSAPATFPIDPTLPLVRGSQFHKALRDGSLFHPAIADTEPDGWGMTVIRRDHAKRRAAARAAGEALPPLDGALDYLLSVDDECRVGALRFQDEAGVFWRPPSTEGHRTTARWPSGNSPASTTRARSREAKCSPCTSPRPPASTRPRRASCRVTTSRSP